jgi:hypothetical protein
MRQEVPENAPKHPLSGRGVPKDLDAEIAQLLSRALSDWLAKEDPIELAQHLQALLALLGNLASD